MVGFQAEELVGLTCQQRILRISEISIEGDQVMGRLTALFIRLREFRKGLSRGQTMTEYALILAAIAVACFAVYAVTGQDINALVSWNQIDKDLTNAL
jgi:Flp pilus assembly pilin Flp